MEKDFLINLISHKTGVYYYFIYYFANTCQVTDDFIGSKDKNNFIQTRN